MWGKSSHSEKTVPYKNVGGTEYRNESDNILAVAKHTSGVSTEGQDVIETLLPGGLR